MTATPGSSPRNPSPPPAARAPLARREVSGLAASYRQGVEANQALHNAAAQAHLVSPATAVGELPAGTVLALSQVTVGEEETYQLPGGKRGLAKSALDKIAAAAGVSWDPGRSGRLDDGRDPHYCHYRAVCTYRTFDGARLTQSGEVEIDLREGSPQLEEMHAKASSSDRGGGADRQILEARKFILRHAESKAKNRAIRALGLRTSYSSKDLEKPFVVAKVMFTGHSEDPEIRREFARATASAFLQSETALYPAALPARATPQRHAAPPLAALETDGFEAEELPEYDPPRADEAPEDQIPY